MPIKTEALALLRAHINFSDSAILSKLELTVTNHSHPMHAAYASIALCKYLQQAPSIEFDSTERVKISAIIKTMAHHPYPLLLINAIILIKKSGIRLTTASSRELSQQLNEHAHPLKFAQAILYLFDAGLLENESADTQRNIQRLAPLTERWFGEPELAKQFKQIPISQFTQSLLDSLLQISEESIDIKTKQDNISRASCATLFQEPVTSLSKTANSRRCRSHFFQGQPAQTEEEFPANSNGSAINRVNFIGV